MDVLNGNFSIFQSGKFLFSRSDFESEILFFFLLKSQISLSVHTFPSIQVSKSYYVKICPNFLGSPSSVLDF